MRVYLRIKALSLAAESKIIRKEMRKYKGESEAYQGLHLHRVKDEREESRATNLALGSLKGLKYSQIERKCYQAPNWKRVRNLVQKYGDVKAQDVEDVITKWSQT